MISFFIPGKAVAQGRPKFAKRGNFVSVRDPDSSRDYKSWVRSCALDAMAGLNGGAAVPMFPREVPLRLSVTVYIERPKSIKKDVLLPVKKPDLDNFLKGISDAMESICYAADQQIVCISARKVYGTPGAHVEITEYKD